jgi:hypothetical protein
MLGGVTEVRALRDLAERYTPHSEVSGPVYERILQLDARDVGAIASLGFVRFLDGDDDLARQQIEAGKAIDPENVEILTLEAALSRDRQTKVSLYRKILEKDPLNRVAIENLRELGLG